MLSGQAETIFQFHIPFVWFLGNILPEPMLRDHNLPVRIDVKSVVLEKWQRLLTHPLDWRLPTIDV